MAIPSHRFSVANTTLCHPIASFPAATFHRPHRTGRFYVKSEAKTDELTGKSTSSSATSSFLSLLCPLLKFFSGGDPSGQRNHALEVATSSLASVARLPWGSRVSSGSIVNQDVSPNPPLPLQLFEFEACPFCRRVREAMTELDLSVKFPFLIDPNTDTLMYESGDIVKYLFNQYGNGRAPFHRTSGKYARLVREALCELELPYVLHNTGEGSTQVPFLVDPNTGVQLDNYQKILAYLFKTYSSATPA